MATGALLVTICGCGKAEPAGCGSDKDCKGDRICEDGRCVAPPEPAPPEAAHKAQPPVAPAPAPRPADAGAPRPAPVEPAPRPAQTDAPRLGPRDAPVMVTLFGDFQCPHTARMMPILAQLLKKHSGPRGTVALEWRHDPLEMHPRSLRVAVAAQAAARQGKFWSFHDKLFADQTKNADADLVRFAREVGLDEKRFEGDLNDPKLLQRVLRDRHTAVALGVRGTPTFFVNGRMLAGAQTAEAFEKVIAEEVAKAKARVASGTPRASVAAAMQRLQSPALAKYLLDGEAPPRPRRRPIDVDQTVWRVPLPEGAPTKGPDDALVTLVLFADFQCPHCRRYRKALGEVLAAHPKDVRLVYLHNPVPVHEDAALAAEAAVEAHAQGRFWAFHDRLFDHQEALKKADLLAHAKAAGLDVAKMKQALDKRSHRDRVREDRELAARVAAVGTPNLYVNGRRVVAARDAAQLLPLVAEELAKARKLVAAGTPRAKVYEAVIAKGTSKRPLAGDKHTFAVKGAPSRGDASAPVELVVFIDFQCPFCRRLVPMLARVEAAFPKKVRTVIKHFPQKHHPRAPAAARAAVCAQRQGRFWPLYDRLFRHPKKLSDDELLAHARAAKLDVEAFRACLGSKEARATVEANLAEGKAAGVRGTPTVFINGRLFTPTTGYNDRSFARALEAVLAGR